jgi:hypothetical protein
MKKNDAIKFCLALVVIFFFAACGKEKSIEQSRNTPTDSSATGLLVKMVYKPKGSLDSTVEILTYDQNKKIKNIFQTFVYVATKMTDEIDVRFYRNSFGMITRYVSAEKIRDTNTVVYNDSIVYTLYSEGSHYKYAIRTVPNLPDPPIKDSLVYSYDSKDRISSVVAWRHDETNGNQLFEYQKTVYTYDGNSNIAKMNITFKSDINTNDPPQVINFTYDDKVSPLDIKSEGLLGGYLGYNSPNNVLTVNDLDTPQKVSYTYQYNSKTQPVSAVETDLITNNITNITFYYQ